MLTPDESTPVYYYGGAVAGFHGDFLYFWRGTSPHIDQQVFLNPGSASGPRTCAPAWACVWAAGCWSAASAGASGAAVRTARAAAGRGSRRTTKARGEGGAYLLKNTTFQLFG